MIKKVAAGATAVMGAAALTLGAMVALVRGTDMAVSIRNPPARILAVAGDVVLGTALLVGCMYMATRLAVRILGVGHADFPPLPPDTRDPQPLSKK